MRVRNMLVFFSQYQGGEPSPSRSRFVHHMTQVFRPIPFGMKDSWAKRSPRLLLSSSSLVYTQLLILFHPGERRARPSDRSLRRTASRGKSPWPHQRRQCTGPPSACNGGSAR
eukprot:2801786-Pyramimonas_sp.AAC.1